MSFRLSSLQNRSPRGLIRFLLRERGVTKIRKKEGKKKVAHTRSHWSLFLLSRMKCPVQFFFFFFFIYIDDLALFLFPSVGREMTRRHGQGYWKKALTLKDPRNQMYKISVAVYETHTRLHRQIPVSIALPTHFVTHYSLPRQPGLEK